MTMSVTESQGARALKVNVTDAVLHVELADGRTLTVPTAWYPRLAHGSDRERSRWSSLAVVSAFIGLNWTRTSASKGCSLGDVLVRRRSL